MENDKWKMFRNYMSNELGISKDDIREWIKDAVAEQAELLLKQTFGNFTITDLIWKKFYNNFMHDFYDDKIIKSCIGQAIAEKIQITVLKEEPIKAWTCNNCKLILHDKNCQERAKTNIEKCQYFTLNKDC